MKRAALRQNTISSFTVLQTFFSNSRRTSVERLLIGWKRVLFLIGSDWLTFVNDPSSWQCSCLHDTALDLRSFRLEKSSDSSVSWLAVFNWSKSVRRHTTDCDLEERLGCWVTEWTRHWDFKSSSFFYRLAFSTLRLEVLKSRRLAVFLSVACRKKVVSLQFHYRLRWVRKYI